ncbi:hypothetical protein SDRG_05862 [Saprolegnia diclina VS20]|uniref:FYVE-type domain-containing protein n=1 Tax=Saprolegnia diclina (strain VS20) TaxID=1156394 RepID=T0QR75_SAPDV|nr:hypothetical protein SDRG_05862 [Saprolegnia diclina VS20]EQC36405.1 hypothetical protein SDRG_05862 [Saprolegnia diclina VS20]|eukprot:XP_008609826.1 hypothetical protein SDRG_05862 [Saprolegnia diclina VS20]
MLELPVPNKFFPPVHLDDADELHLRRLAKDKLRLMTDLLHGQQTQTLSWTPCEGQTADGCHVLKAHFVDLEANSQRAHACVLYRASVVLTASVPEVMSVLAVPKTDDYRRMMKSVYGHDFLDGYVLHTLPRKKLHRPTYFYTSLKWCALAARNAVGGRGSDFCFLEYAGIRKESATSLLGFCIQQSVAMDGEVPDFGSYGLTRDAFLRTGILVTPTDRDGHVRVTSFCQVQSATLAGASGSADYEDVMRRRVAAIRGLQSYLERGRLGKLPFVERWRWVRDEDRKTCSVCVRNFTFRRRHHCRQCGEVVCSGCAPYREVETPTAGPNRVRICNVCFARAHGIVHRPLSDSVLESSVYTDDGASFSLPPVTPQRLAYRRSSTSTVRSPVTRRTRSQRSASMGDLDDDDDDDDDPAVPVRRLAHPRPLRDTFERAEPPSLEHAMAEITQRIKATQLAILSSVSSREREMQRWPAMPPVPSPASSSSSSSSEPAPEAPPVRPYAFPLYDSSDVDDEASAASYKTNATDDTECPFAPQNYHQLMQQLQLSTVDGRDDLSDFHLELNVNHGLDDDDLAISEIGTEFLTMERPTPIVVVDPPPPSTPKPPSSSGRHLPPPMPASMKASLLARQAALRSSEAAMSNVSSCLWKEPTSAPLPPPPPSLPHSTRRLQSTQSQSTPKAVWAPSPPPVAANAMRSLKVDESSGDIQASLAHQAFAQLEAECPSTPERTAILQALVTTFSSLLSHKEESDFCVLNRSDHAFAAVLQAYPSTLKLLQLAGYAIYPQRCVLSDFDAVLLTNLVGTLKRILSDPQHRHSYYSSQWSF